MASSLPSDPSDLQCILTFLAINPSKKPELGQRTWGEGLQWSLQAKASPSGDKKSGRLWNGVRNPKLELTLRAGGLGDSSTSLAHTWGAGVKNNPAAPLRFNPTLGWIGCGKRMDFGFHFGSLIYVFPSFHAESFPSPTFSSRTPNSKQGPEETPSVSRSRAVSPLAPLPTR